MVIMDYAYTEASYPGHSQLFNVFRRATLKSWEWPRDEATYTVGSYDIICVHCRQGEYCVTLQHGGS